MRNSGWSSDVCSSDLTAGARQNDQTPAALRNPGSEEPFRPNPLWDVNNPNGEPAGLPVLETWDGAKRYLDDLEFDTNSPFIARPQGMTSDTRAIALPRRPLLNELDQHTIGSATCRERVCQDV